MKSKKLLVGSAIMALAIGTTAVSYAAGNSQNNDSLKNVKYQETVSTSSDDGLSFDNIDENNLPEGVVYQEEVSMDVTGGIPLK